MLQQDGPIFGDVKNDNTVDILDEEHKRVEVAGVDIERREVGHVEFVHHDGVDSVDFLAALVLTVVALFHVIEDDGLDVSQDNNQVMSQELNRLHFPFPSFLEHDRRGKHVFFLDVIQDYFVGELFVNSGY